MIDASSQLLSLVSIQDLCTVWHLPTMHLTDIHLNISTDLLAQQFTQDVMGDIGKGWNNFVKTGQIWALIIGVIVGYLLRSITHHA
ncbi:MAG: hypothetical protein NW214_14835 [Pseudanabaenaceae cyanobacterium bins.39]|nr:hypothetical protein [Pseudanabaenaceae cyanobacterium bins.39]